MQKTYFNVRNEQNIIYDVIHVVSYYGNYMRCVFYKKNRADNF